MKYYQVEAKCGHVGRYNYILRKFYVVAENGREASLKVRNIARVKHHQKYAIRRVDKITYDEYLEGRNRNSIDPYLNVHSIQEQKLFCSFKEDEIFREPEVETYQKKTNKRRRLIETIYINEWKRQGVLAYE